MHNYIILQFFI